MATDSTELTFVRCPACRSLVPAMSSRCRMCGAGLDPVNESKDAKEQPASDRERKKTVVYKPGMEVATEAPAEIEKPEDLPVKEASSDPLGSFVTEESTSQQEPSFEPVQKSEHLEAMDESEIDIQPEIEMTPEPSPKVIVEQGKGKRGGLSFSNTSPEEAEVKTTEIEPKLDVDPLASHYDDVQHKVEPVKPAKLEAPKFVAERSQPMPKQVNSSTNNGAATMKKRSIGESLVGWLVSASNDENIIELRAGKRFITASQLKDSDLVLDHDSISTPHAMLLVLDDGNCVVQDLMSDNGVYVRSFNESDFVKTEERFELVHGQRVVFGDLEFIVVIIPR